MRLRPDTVDWNHLCHRNRNRTAKVPLQAFSEASQRLFRQIRSRTWLCRIRHHDKPCPKWPLIDPRERVVAKLTP
jgi:hypothetical protein